MLALPGICDHLVGVPGYYHGLMVGGHEEVSLPELGIVQFLHVHYPSGGAIVLLQYPQHDPGQLLLHFFLQWTSTIAGV